jgi:nickel-dependent lactate racemase
MEFNYGFGKGSKTFTLSDKNIIKELHQNQVETGLTGAEEVRRALGAPIGTPRLAGIVHPGERIAIITSDITRPMPSRTVLPVLLEELQAAGVALEDVTVVFALGSHRRHTVEEQKYLVGEEVFHKVKCIDSDPGDCAHLGVTAMGTPVDIFTPVARADRRICLGNIEYHYFAGYSGGAKAIMPGVSTPAAIQANHSAMVRDGARAGHLDGNPVRGDLEQAIGFVPIDFIVNVVLDENKTIIKAVAGHSIHAHREGCRFLDRLYKVEIPRQADIVVTTPGGYPKDLNVYQAQKALDNAKHAVRQGGVIIWLAACTEGMGSQVFERWMNEAESPDGLIRDIQARFELGGHKAAAIALVLKRADIYLVSDLDPALVRKMFMEPFADMDQALAKAFSRLGQDAKVLLMPHGGSTLPVPAGVPG